MTNVPRATNSQSRFESPSITPSFSGCFGWPRLSFRTLQAFLFRRQRLVDRALRQLDAGRAAVVVHIYEGSILFRDRQVGGCLFSFDDKESGPTETLDRLAKGVSMREETTEELSMFVQCCRLEGTEETVSLDPLHPHLLQVGGQIDGAGQPSGGPKRIGRLMDLSREQPRGRLPVCGGWNCRLMEGGHMTRRRDPWL